MIINSLLKLLATSSHCMFDKSDIQYEEGHVEGKFICTKIKSKPKTCQTRKYTIASSRWIGSRRMRLSRKRRQSSGQNLDIADFLARRAAFECYNKEKAEKQRNKNSKKRENK